MLKVEKCRIERKPTDSHLPAEYSKSPSAYAPIMLTQSPPLCCLLSFCASIYHPPLRSVLALTIHNERDPGKCDGY
jgi:hypothetical protein